MLRFVVYCICIIMWNSHLNDMEIQNKTFYSQRVWIGYSIELRHGKTGNKKRTTCLATLLQNELNSDVARFTTHIKPVLQQIRLLKGLNVGGNTRNVAIQLALQQYCKKSCTFFVARSSVPLVYITSVATVLKSENNSYTCKLHLYPIYIGQNELGHAADRVDRP